MTLVEEYLQSTIKYLKNMPIKDIEAAVDVLNEARYNGKTVFIMGNGGSAATASHCVVDLLKNTLDENKPRFKCISLTDNVPTLTAMANDINYEQAFLEPLKALAQPGDVIIGFSGSGNSPNVINAMIWAKANDMTVIAIGGRDGGKMKAQADVSIVAPTPIMAQIEDAHLIINHLIAISLVGELRPPLA